MRLGRGRGDAFVAWPVEVEALEQTITDFTRDGWNLWFEINESHYDAPGGRSSAQHVTRLTALYADLDFKPKPGGLGSLPEAMEVVTDLSNALGVQPTAIVYSGNGIQPYWPISDGQVTDFNRNEIASVLKRWGLLVKKFAAANHGAADSVFDLPRILRVPGSINFKDPANPKATAIDFFDGVAPVDLAWVREVLDDYEITTEMVEVDTEIVSPMSMWEWAETDCQFYATALQEIRLSSPAARHPWALKWAALIYGMIRSECVTEQGFYALRDALIERFKYLLASEGANRPYSVREMTSILKTGQQKAESWSKEKLGQEMRQHTHEWAPDFSSSTAPPANVSSIFTRQKLTATGQVPTVLGSLALVAETRSQQRLANASFSDTGNAERLGQWLHGKFIFVPGLGWHEWAGNRYVEDTAGHVVEATKDMFVQMLATAPDKITRDWAHASLSKGRIKAAIEFATTLQHLSVNSLQLDSKPYELNTPDGIVNLATGAVRPPNPLVDFHTLQTAVAPAPGQMPRFLGFLMWAMGETAVDLGQPTSRVAYLQRLFGLAAIGKLLQHVFPIFLGVGQNGKTTLLELIAGVLGQYATVMPAKFLVERRGETHPTEIAQLRGVRMAINSEVPPTANFDEELVKRLTGEHRLRARVMHGDFFEFDNVTTHFLGANHLPAVRVGGTSFWRRTRKIDFDYQIPLMHQNPNLVTEILAQEGPAILQWVIEGARDVAANGLRDPHSVVVATRQYQLEEDTMARFLDDNMMEVEGASVSRETVYDVYRLWTVRQGYTPLQFVKFCREVTQIFPRTNLGAKSQFTNMSFIPRAIEYAE